MRCIYCLHDTHGVAGKGHVVPEAVARNDLVLPLGAVCDSCNHYLGRLDSILGKHPLVSLGAQLLRVPGKKGKVRRVMGTVSQEQREHAISIPIAAEPVVSSLGTAWSVTPLVSDEFNDFEFRRALHHVGLNALAHEEGVDRACEPSLHAVRPYVRQPNKGERWGFGQLPLFEGMSREGGRPCRETGERRARKPLPQHQRP